MVSVTDNTIPLPLTAHTPWSPVIFDKERYACMPGSDRAFIVGLVVIDKLGLNSNKEMFQLARARRAGQVAKVETPGYSSSQKVRLPVSALQHGRNVELELDEAVETFLPRGPERYMAPKDELLERRAAPDRGKRQALEKE